ncbi:MAG TPA: glycosyltransferase family 1 protein [Chitinophagaceae bacterium]|nr:glycosyltransferase family 1 protein [Chitinophagaceae bacterium]
MAGPSEKPVVTFFHRKPRPVGNYSVEFIFEDVRKRLASQIEARTSFSKYESTGLFKRLYNCMEAAFRQKGVNHVTGDVNYLGLWLSRRHTIHTVLDCVYLTNSSGIKHKVLKLFWLGIPVKRSKYITAISTSTKNEILQHVSCDPDKIKVIYVAISERFQRKDRPFNKGCPRILQIGAAPNKNIPRLIEALQGIPCILEIIGKQSDEYERMLKEKNIRYEYKWGLSDDEMLQRYEAADIIALVSTYEGFGMPILEGQAVGRPVITANVYSMPEVAGDAACLADPFDVASIRNGIVKIIQDDAYRQSLVEKGFENVKRFDPQKIALEYFALYKDVYQNNR